jgi:phage terminase small subunit
MAGKKKLTAYESKFVEGILSGATQADAYRNAGYKCDRLTPEGIAVKAYKVANKDHIKDIIAQRRKEMESAAIWTRKEALEKLRGIIDAAVRYMVDDGKYSAAASQAATRAIEQANRMCGYNEAERLEISGAKIKIELTDD